MDVTLLNEIEKSLKEAEKEIAVVKPEKKTFAQTKHPMSAVFTRFERNNKEWMVKHPKFDITVRMSYGK